MNQQPLKPLPEILLELKQVKTDFELSKKIATYDGYFQYYFEILKDFETQKEAFEHVNALHLKYFKKIRYSDWHSFAKVKNRWLKQ